MPDPRAQAKRLDDLRQIVCPNPCCIGTLVPAESAPNPKATLVPAESATARPASELQFTPRPSEPASARPMSADFTPRTATGRTDTTALPPIVRDQVLELERRLQSSIAFIMEQQYEKLSGELLNILWQTQQKTAPRTSEKSNGTTAGYKKGNSLNSAFTLHTQIAAPEHTPPLLQLGKHKMDARASEHDAPNPPVLVSPEGTKLPQKGEVILAHSPSKSQQPNGRESHGADGTESSCNVASHQGELILSQLQNRPTLRKQEGRVRDYMKSKYGVSMKVSKKISMVGAWEIEDDEEAVPLKMRILQSPVFDSVCALAIVLNSILIGFSAEWLTTHEEETPLLIMLGNLCNLFFLFELMFRLFVFRCSYFCNDDKVWNAFDFSLVMFSIIDFAMWATLGNSGAGSVGSTLKIVKMLRIVRIFRVFRFFKELSLLALMIMDSLKSLVWALLMLIIIIYVFAICFTQNATEFLRNIDTFGDMDTMVRKYFGSLPRTIYSLVLSMLGGVSWGEIADPLMHMDALSAFLFFFYICFTLLAVLNVITAVFVDNAVETAKTERDFLIQREIELREKLLAEMRVFFEEMDKDRSGSVSFEELRSYFADERAQSYFQALGLDASDAERLFKLIDTDNNGAVQVAEFLDGCIRLKGEARSIDVNTILWHCRHMHSKLNRIMND